MVAKVISGKSIRGALHYSEQKVTAGKALCLSANLFGADPTQLTLNSKLLRFEKLIQLNARAKTNAIHISLNFDSTENLSATSLKSIANDYMSKIGFDNQPYLVYQHFDAAHTHLHILTTNIKEDGKRIDIHNIGRNQSEQARKEIEKSYGLVKAESKSRKELTTPIPPARIYYGKSETKRSITNVVRFALSYKFTSLPEFNAVLRQFNVIADRGKEDSQMFLKKGLVYTICDNNGNHQGIPIKASSIYGKPTLPQLEKLFPLNEKLRLPGKDRIKKCINSSFNFHHITSKEEFTYALQKQGIYVLLRQSTGEKIYGITFVDNITKTVFNGSDLGKDYSASALLKRIHDAPASAGSDSSKGKYESDEGASIEWNWGLSEIISDVTTAQQSDFSSPDSAHRKRKKKKRKGPSR